ncbi:MAG TPA: hypothetical protein VN843_29510, partial [Anaerolineales bacterium]|nr:hypothetical protein [Anaerolineales bacterium]
MMRPTTRNGDPSAKIHNAESPPAGNTVSSRTEANIETKRRVLPAGACDCHAHVYGPFVEYPLPATVSFKPPLASIEALEQLWEVFGIERGVIVQGSAYG